MTMLIAEPVTVTDFGAQGGDPSR
ncbi:MAG: hypothetical protein QOI90_421, partial [Mycobacterium sp.]|nr:hypothetical protein [Mycobacterium sp.]